MIRTLLLVAILFAWNCGLLQSADEPAAKPAATEPAPTNRRLDRAKLMQLRERLKNRTAEAAPGEAAPLKRVSWTVGETTREALVYVPPKSDKTAQPPLVFAFHGHGGRAEYSARKLAIHEHWPEAICVYPQGLPTPVPVIDVEGKMPGWQKYVGDQNDRDLAFFDAMLKSLRTEHGIDDNRVYSTGHSNGGFFTYVLWAARGDVLAAVAPIAACLDLRDFAQQKPKPVLHVAGEQDRIVRFAMQERTLEQIRKLNGCDADGKPAGKLCTEYASPSGPPVVQYIHPGGHEIPAEAPARIAEFFQAHAKK